jgi:hypothetical protein
MSVDREHQSVRGFINVQSALPTLIATASILSASGSAVVAGDVSDVSARTASVSDKSNEELLKKMRAMEQRIEMLEGKLKQQQKQGSASATATPPQPTAPAQATATPAPARAARAQATDASPPTGNAPSPTPTAPANNGLLGLTDSPVPGLSLGAYGEVKFGAFKNPDAGGKWQNGFDVHRFVLLPTYAITSNIIFNAEIEFEHGGIAFDADDKRHGTAEIEQLWIDFKMHDKFNWRAPGVDLVPIGYINQHHEPTQFYSVNRPELYNGLIPSTFMVPATSIYGRLMDGLSYQFQASSSVEDFGDDFDKRTDGNSVPPFPAGYVAGITGLSALHDSRPVIGDFRQLNNTIAYAGKLDFAPPILPGFAGSVSGYFSPNITPRGAYADTGATLGRNSLALFDAEFRYRVPNTGLELRGEYVRASFGNPANLRANNDSDPTNNVGKSMFGWSGEVAYHFQLGTILGSEWEAVPFYRYTYENLQTNGFAGTDANEPTGAGRLQFYTAGIAVFPSPKVALKATYQKVKNKDPGGTNSDSVLGGVGFFF